MLLDYLRDMVKYTSRLGFNTLELNGEDGVITIEGSDENNKTLVLKGKFLKQVPELNGRCGLGNVEWLSNYVNAYDHKDDTAVTHQQAGDAHQHHPLQGGIDECNQRRCHAANDCKQHHHGAEGAAAGRHDTRDQRANDRPNAAGRHHGTKGAHPLESIIGQYRHANRLWPHGNEHGHRHIDDKRAQGRIGPDIGKAFLDRSQNARLGWQTGLFLIFQSNRPQGEHGQENGD